MRGELEFGQRGNESGTCGRCSSFSSSRETPCSVSASIVSTGSYTPIFRFFFFHRLLNFFLCSQKYKHFRLDFIQFFFLFWKKFFFPLSNKHQNHISRFHGNSTQIILRESFRKKKNYFCCCSIRNFELFHDVAKCDWKNTRKTGKIKFSLICDHSNDRLSSVVSIIITWSTR